MEEGQALVSAGTAKVNQLLELAAQYGAAFAVKILAAIAFWVVGRWLIGFAVGLLQKGLGQQKVDPTVLRYLGNFVTVTLNILLVIGILGYFGVQTTTFAALIAAVGLAIGMAWSGLLANLAAGGFIIVLRPFKVGDFVTVGGVTGTVTEIGLFVTAINTPDNVLTLVGNNKIFGDTIQNYSHNAFRRVDLKAQLAGRPTGKEQRRYSGSASPPSTMCWRHLQWRSRFSSSTWSGRCWRYGPTAIPTITGRSTSTPTR